MNIRPCCVIPSRNHYRTLPSIIRRLRELCLTVFVIDDASDDPARDALARMHAPGDGVTVVRLPERAGKGGATIFGFTLADASGFSHVVQVDADGQHDLDELCKLLELAQRHPHALINGIARYEGYVPTGRRYGRYFTHAWVWIETLSFQVKDSMCGFRIYPLNAVVPLIASEQIGQFMDFDTSILVRLYWHGVAVIGVPVKVVYPAENTSNFEIWRDNWRITKMHTRLVLEMLPRFPILLRRRFFSFMRRET